MSKALGQNDCIVISNLKTKCLLSLSLSLWWYSFLNAFIEGHRGGPCSWFICIRAVLGTLLRMVCSSLSSRSHFQSNLSVRSKPPWAEGALQDVGDCISLWSAMHAYSHAYLHVHVSFSVRSCTSVQYCTKAPYFVRKYVGVQLYMYNAVRVLRTIKKVNILSYFRTFVRVQLYTTTTLQYV